MSGLSADSASKIVSAPEQLKKPGDSQPATTQQIAQPNNPEEKKEKGQSLQELIGDGGDINSSGLTEQQQLQEFLRKYSFKS